MSDEVDKAEFLEEFKRRINYHEYGKSCQTCDHYTDFPAGDDVCVLVPSCEFRVRVTGICDHWRVVI